MGSFFATCSVTRQTIVDGQEMYMQFMVPHKYSSVYDSVREDIFKAQFINTVRHKGLEEALKHFENETPEKINPNNLAPKGMNVTEYGEWVPFGPAIRGYYDDGGNIVPLDDEDSQNRVKILETLLGGLPFKTIMNAAQDDRWFYYGILQDLENPSSINNIWKLEGLDISTTHWVLDICKQLSLTYFHVPVYDELVKSDFCGIENDGVAKQNFRSAWRLENIEITKESINKFAKNAKFTNPKMDVPDFENKDVWVIMDIVDSKCFLGGFDPSIAWYYLYGIVRENLPTEWLEENIRLVQSLREIDIPLTQSEYGSQHKNWGGWKRINNALAPKIDQEIKRIE
jgi:hypothetical protein